MAKTGHTVDSKSEGAPNPLQQNRLAWLTVLNTALVLCAALWHNCRHAVFQVQTPRDVVHQHLPFLLRSAAPHAWAHSCSALYAVSLCLQRWGTCVGCAPQARFRRRIRHCAGPNDGTVSVEETRLPAVETDFITLDLQCVFHTHRMLLCTLHCRADYAGRQLTQTG